MAWIALLLSAVVGGYVGKHWKINSELRPWEKVVDIIGGILICQGIGLLPQFQSSWTWIKYALIIFVVVSVLHALLYGNKGDSFAGRLGTAVGITSMMFIRGFGFLGCLIMFFFGRVLKHDSGKNTGAGFTPNTDEWKGLPMKILWMGTVYVCVANNGGSRWYCQAADPDQKQCVLPYEVKQTGRNVWEVMGQTAYPAN